MLHFDSDYMEGALPAIIERLHTTNFNQTAGYGTDEICESARARIRRACDAPEASVHFLVGGTQTNAVVLDQLLCPWEGVLSATSGHINAHEAGAVEGLGHKILPLEPHEGKLLAADVRAYCENFFADANRDHMVAPGVVYLSHPTEYGTIYSLAELEDLSAVCDEFDLALFMDGARLGYGLAARGADVTLPDIARLCDAFYIGGTKVGALFGEAVVFPRPTTCRHRRGCDVNGRPAPIDQHFFTIMKKRGALLAKGRMLGIQFDELFSSDASPDASAVAAANPPDTAATPRDAAATPRDATTATSQNAATHPNDALRYLQAGAHGVALAQRLADAFTEKGYELAIDSPTNQLFPILDDETHDRLSQQVTFSFWERTPDGKTVTRFACSWATRPENVEALIALL